MFTRHFFKDSLVCIRALTLALLLVCTFMVENARAEGIFYPSFMFDRDTVKDATGQLPDTSGRQFYFDFRLGYYFDLSGLYLGAIYKYEDFGFPSGEAQGFSYGPTIGYVREPFVFTLSYFLGAERKYTVGGMEDKFTSGSGYELTIGYLFAFEPDIRIGPEIVFRTTEYSRSQIGTGVESDQPLEVASIKPALALWFAF